MTTAHYKKLGQYIKPINIRNKELEDLPLMGLSINKIFIPSIANTIGTNMGSYKLIKRNQFAYGPVTSRNGDKITIALFQDHDRALISQAYIPFEVTDESILNPEYLMMWFRRPEFNRYARFKSHGSARETFDWDEMCEVELPIPSIAKQNEIVKEYNTVVNRITLNEQLNKKLEETAQALYKQWFVDFEFPDAEGKPYKSSDGEMVYNEELNKEIPVGWNVVHLGNLCKKITKGTTPKLMSDSKTLDMNISYLKGESILENHFFDYNKISFINESTHNNLLRSQLEVNDICYSIAGSLDKFTLVDSEILPANTNQAIAIIRVNNEIISYEYIYGYFISKLQKEFYNYNVQQAVQANLSLTTISSLPIIVPNTCILGTINEIMTIWINNRNTINTEMKKLRSIEDLLLSKMTRIEIEKETLN